MKRTFSIALLTALSGCGGSSNNTTVATSNDAPTAMTVATGSIDAAITGAHRSEDNRARDAHRHPKETLEFFGLQPNMTVIEMAPGEGWYTEILAPVLRDDGRLIAAIPDPEQSEYGRTFLERMGTAPEIFDRVQHVVFGPPEHTSLGDDNSADMVVTFRSAHGWINRGQADQVFAAMFAVLKPGGVLGIEQHRADDGANPTESAPTGYVPEPYVIQLAQNAGFVFEERSDINRNPNDTHDHPEGVWTLPPTLRLGAQDRERYIAIGESDRMTLRFRKPAAAE